MNLIRGVQEGRGTDLDYWLNLKGWIPDCMKITAYVFERKHAYHLISYTLIIVKKTKKQKTQSVSSSFFSLKPLTYVIL